MKKVKLFCDSTYCVDDLGTVYSKSGKPLKPSINHKGYKIVNILTNGKRKGISVHVAVISSFIPKPFKDAQVNHIDGDKLNNSLENLEWCTCKENVTHALYTLGQVSKRGRGLYALKGDSKLFFRSLRECAKYLNCHHSFVYAVLKGYEKQCKGYTFEWADGETGETQQI